MFRFLLIVMLAGMILLTSAYAADESLILYLNLDEGAGKEAVDSSNQENVGEIVGNVKWVDGKSGNALEFLSGSYIMLPEIPLYDFTNAVSLMAWVKTTSVTTWA